MEAKRLYIKKDIDGNVVSFPSEANPAVINTFVYDAKRMGGTPTITATISYERPLDDDWSKEEYVEFNGEKYYVTSTPSSSKANDSIMYKHEVTFTSGREVLDNTLFFDVVTTNLQTQSNDRYRSNKSDFTFGGNIREFVDRINSSLAYCNIYRPDSNDKGYYVVIDEGFDIDDVKELSFSDQYITEVLQLINTEYGLEYYWVGSVCHIGKCQHDLTTKEYPVLRYGRNDALLSIGRENSNSKVVDMVTGYGSSDNIQYYYPNDNEYGEAIFDVSNVKKKAVSINLGVLLSKYPNPYGTRFTLCKNKERTYTGQTQVQTAEVVEVDVEENDRQDMTKEGTIEQSFTFPMRKGNRLDLTGINVRCTYSALSNGFYEESVITYKIFHPGDTDKKASESKDRLDSTFVADMDGVYTFTAIAKYTAVYRGDEGGTGQAQGRITLSISGIANIIYTPNAVYVFACGDKNIAYDDSGIVLENHEGLPHWECDFSYDPETGWYADGIDQIMDAASVTITDRLWLEPTGVLMPSIYRATGGANRFYYAQNHTHKKPDGSGEYYDFKNIYNSNSPHQGSYTHDDIKPTIRGIRNDVIQADGLGQLFGEIADVAFDKEDSDMVDSNGNYIHSYFYIKLHKFSGEYGFSLFDSALSTDNAKIEMIECQGCPACSFTIGCHWVNEENKCYNIVLTDGNGNLMSESDKMNSAGDYILNNTYVKDNKSNQDSTKEELWICVQKDNSTLGVVMPNASAGFKPKKGDKFVITGIKPPKALTLAAEKRLEEALIKDMYNDNEDKFNYTIKFSRIFLQENPDFASKLNENSRVVVEYNGHKVELFTSNYSVKVDKNALASVEVELVKSLDITESSIKQAIEAATNNSPIVIGGQGNGGLQGGDGGAYLSKVSSDTAHGFIKFLQGLQIGSPFIPGLLGTGGVFRKDADGKTYIEVDKIYARVKAIFDNVEIRNFQHTSGNRIVSVAGMNIVRVKNVDANGNVIGDNDNTGAITTAYRCYFRGKDGDNICTNDFVVDDLAFCSRTNVDENLTHKRYWRAVVRKSNEVDINGNHWIDLSVDDCEKDSDIPSVGDDVSQLGNKTKTERQGVIIEMSSGEEAPCYQIFQGINDYTLDKKCMVDLGYNSATGRAKMNVYGDTYIGDIDGNSFLRYDSLGKTLEIKAKIDAKSTIGDRDIDAYIKDNTLSRDDVENILGNSDIISSLQNQIDGAIETWYYEGKPTLENLPAQNWTDDETKNKHIGDLYYDKASGKAYRFLKDSTNTYTWAIITDEDITKALALAGEKKRIFGTTPTPPYDVNDLWVYAVYPSDGSKYNKDILRCITAKSAGEKFSIDDWALASDYATNTKVAQLDYLRDALKNDTAINGGLILSTLIALRDKSKNIQSGINGAVQDAKYKGGGIAAWYGGEMGDIEDKSNYPGVTNWAKSLLRFDGSGYLANGNISWGSTGNVTIKDLSALINSDKTDVLNVLASISGMFSTTVKGSEVLLIPQKRFGELFINRLRKEDLDNNDVVLTQQEMKDRFVTIDWFNKVFSVVDDKKSDLPVNGNISAGASIHAKMSLWSDGGISALGNSVSSGGTGGSGGGGLDAELLWSLLGNSGTEQISKSHLADALAGYATEDWVEGKGYLTNRDVYTKEEIDAKDWSSNKGTVTSVGITMPTGFSVSGSPITEKGILAVVFASGYSLPTTAKQSNWDTVYNWYSGITGSDTDTIINKWGEIISFLDGIEDTETLSGIVNGINQSITAEANRAKAEERSLSKSITDEVSRAKAAEQTLTSSISTNTSAINVLKGYFTNGVAKSAVKLQTARKIWGNTFDGTQDVNGDLILPNGKKIVIGGASLSWDADNKSVKIDGSVYATGGLSALGNSDTTGGGGGGLMGTIVPYAKAIALTTQNEGEEIASAWSVKMLYDKIETIDVSGQLTSYLTKQEAQTLYQPVGNYLTSHQSLDGYVNGIAVEGTGNAVTTVAKSGKTVKFTKGATFLTSITKAQVEGVLTGNITTHTHSQYLTSHQDISGKADRSELSRYLPLTGGTLTGPLTVKQFILGYNYSRHAGKNAPAFVFDKPGSYMTGIGANGETDTIYFSCATISGSEASWITSYKQKWKFNGTIYQENNAVIHAGNIGSQSVNYAMSAGSVAWNNVSDRPTSMPASDVYAWAKASSKPGYSWGEISGKPSTFAPSSHTHKWAEITDRITKVSQLSNDSGYITSSASISGNAGSATRLQTARTIWGQSFNGTGNVSGALSGVTTIAASGQVSVGSLKIGSVTITYDSTNKGLKIDGGGLYSTSYVSALGESTASGSSGGSSVVAVPYVNAKNLTTEDTSKVASAYSVAQLSSLITSNTTSISSLQSSMSGITNSIASLSQRVNTLEGRVLSLENNSGGSGSIGDSVTLSSITGKNDLLTISTSNMVFPNATTFRTLTTGQPALVMMNLNGTNAVQLFGVQALQFVTTTNGSTWTRKNFNVSKAISLGLLT